MKKNKERKVSLKTSLKLGYTFIKHKPLRIIISSLFLSISLALLSIMSSLLLNINGIFLETAKSIYNYNLVTVSLIKEIETEGDITLIQKSAPENISVPYINSYLPFTEVLGSSIKIFNNDNTEFINSRFEPSVNESDIVPIYGRDIYSSYEVLANINLAKELNIKETELVGKEIELNKNIIIETNLNEQKIIDSLSIKETLTIVGVINETQGLNSASIYYSYENFYRVLNQTYLDNVSLAKEETYSVIERLNDAKSDDPLLGYSMLYEVSDPSSFKKSLGENYDVTSFTLTYIESNTSLIESIVTVLDFFLVLILIGSFLLELFIMSTIYEEQKKTLALYKTFCISKNNYLTLFFAVAEIFAFITIIFSFIAEGFLNIFLNNFTLNSGLPKLFTFQIFNIPNLIMVSLVLVLAYVAAQYSLTRLDKQMIILSLAEDIC